MVNVGIDSCLYNGVSLLFIEWGKPLVYTMGYDTEMAQRNSAVSAKHLIKGQSNKEFSFMLESEFISSIGIKNHHINN